jgi:phage-related protein
MAGIWEIVQGDTGEGAPRLNVSLVRTELTGLALGVRTRPQAKLNLEAKLGRVLDAAETTDLNALADEFETGNIQAKLVYSAKTEFALNAAELNLIDETEFRTVLGI